MSREGVRVGVEAAAEFRLDRKTFDDIIQSENGMVAKVLERAALATERRAKRACPVDTGRLRASITHALERDHRGLSAIIGTNVDYAVYVEFGTSDTPARPFLRSSLVAGNLTRDLSYFTASGS